MNHQQLNSLAIRSQQGCEESRKEIIFHFLPIIYRLSDKHWLQLDSQERFEKNCLQRISEAIRKFDPNKGSFAWQAIFRIRNLLYQHIKRKRGIIVYFDDVITDGGEGQGNVVYEADDKLAVVDRRLLVNEKITLLAEGDLRKMAILNAWIFEFNDSDTASLLAERFGGNSESHRKFIQRFRTRCQTLLARAV